MPNIKPIDAGVIAFRPSDMGAEAAAATGRRIGAFYHQAAQAQQTTGIEFGRAAGSAMRDIGEAVDQHNTHNEIARGGLAMEQAALNAENNWTAQVKKALANPTDPSVAGMDQRFMQEDVERSFDTFRQGFTTRRAQDWAEQRIIQFRNHMHNVTAADMSRIGADQVKMSAASTVNVASNRAFEHPSDLDDAMTSIDGYMDGHKDEKGNVITPGVVATSRMNAADATNFSITFRREAKAKVVNSAIQGRIRDGQPYDDIVNKYGAFLNQAAIDKYAKEEDAQKRRDEADRRRMEREAKIDLQDKSREREQEIYQKLDSDDPKERASVTRHSLRWNEPALTVESQNRLVRYMEKEQKPERESTVSSLTRHQLWAESIKPDVDHDELIERAAQAMAKNPGEPGSLSARDYRGFLDDLSGRKTPEGRSLFEARRDFFLRYGPAIDGGASGRTLSALGSIQVSKWMADAMKQEKDIARTGGQYKPIDLYREGSPVFIGTPEARAKYEKSLQEAISFQTGIGVKKGEPDGTREHPLVVPADRFNTDADFRASLKGKWILVNGQPRQVP